MRARDPRDRGGVATAAIIVLACSLGLAAQQPATWPPVLLPTPSDPAAPPASLFAITGRGQLAVRDAAGDVVGNTYLAGWGSALDVPGLDRGAKAEPDKLDALVVKVDASGRAVWATYIGGTDPVLRDPFRGDVPNPDSASAIAVDAGGQVYLAGSTPSGNFPVVGGLQASRLGLRDAFFTKLSADGRRILYSTYFGGGAGSTSFDWIAVGPGGETWLAGTTTSGQLTTTHNLASDLRPGPFVLKLNPAGSIVWSTRLPVARIEGFAVDPAGRAHVLGNSCERAARCARSVMRLDESGARLQVAASLPPTFDAPQYPHALALLHDGRIVVTGSTDDTLPLVNPWNDVRPCPNICSASFIAIVGSTGEIETLSYLDVGTFAAVTTDAWGRISLLTHSTSPRLPLVRPLVDRHVDGPVYTSRDRGTTWEILGRETAPALDVRDLAFDAGRGSIYFSNAQDLVESRDDTRSWQRDRGRIGNSWGVTVDPRQPDARYAIFTDDVYRGEGDAWQLALRAGGGLYVRTIAVSPHDSSVWAAGNRGVDRSDDGGRTWMARNSGLPNLRGSSSTVVTLAFHPQHVGVAFAGTQIGLYVTSDNGANWQELTSGMNPPPHVRAIAFDPVDGNTIYAGTSNYGLLRSADGGRSWQQQLETTRVSVVQTDPMKVHIVFAGGTDLDGRPAFYRSIDWGRSFQRADSGLYLRGAPSRLLVDPRDSARLYLGTSAFNPVPYVIRYAPSASNPRVYTSEFATYLGDSGTSTDMAAATLNSSPTGDLLIGLQNTRIPGAPTVSVLRIGR